MKNLEQILAKKLLSEYKTTLEILENFRQNEVEKGFAKGEICAIMEVAQSIWGTDELNLRSHFWFIDTLTEIANSKRSSKLEK
jgi:hypothetical protein